jgi:hypothetical protein
MNTTELEQEAKKKIQRLLSKNKSDNSKISNKKKITKFVIHKLDEKKPFPR